jgi:cobalt-zinc-cadmium efflux system membrane fusion protein
MSRKGLAAGIAVLMTLLTAGCGEQPQPVRAATVAPSKSTSNDIALSDDARQAGGIRTEVAETLDLSADVTANGEVLPDEDLTFRVGAHVSGRIEKVEVNLGDRVAPEQILLRMHSHDIHETRAAYFVAQDAVRQAEERAAFARRVQDRTARLLSMQAVSREQAEQAETDYKSSLAALDSAKAMLTKERTHLEDVLEIPVDANGPKEVDTIPVRSPASGVVIERKATPGTVATEGDILMTLTDPASLWVIAHVDEADLSALHPGQAASIKVRAYPERVFTGKVEQLGESLDPATRTLQVRILVPNPTGLLKPEMFASVAIARGVLRRSVMVAREAIQDMEGKPTLFVETSAGHYQPRTVATGMTSNGRVEILSGLKAGERVVNAGAFELKSELLKASMQED